MHKHSLACKPSERPGVEVIVTAFFPGLAPSMAHAHMDGCIRTLPHTHKANIAGDESIGVEV